MARRVREEVADLILTLGQYSRYKFSRSHFCIYRILIESLSFLIFSLSLRTCKILQGYLYLLLPLARRHFRRNISRTKDITRRLSIQCTRVALASPHHAVISLSKKDSRLKCASTSASRV